MIPLAKGIPKLSALSQMSLARQYEVGIDCKFMTGVWLRLFFIQISDIAYTSPYGSQNRHTRPAKDHTLASHDDVLGLPLALDMVHNAGSVPSFTWVLTCRFNNGLPLYGPATNRGHWIQWHKGEAVTNERKPAPSQKYCEHCCGRSTTFRQESPCHSGLLKLKKRSRDSDADTTTLDVKWCFQVLVPVTLVEMRGIVGEKLLIGIVIIF